MIPRHRFRLALHAPDEGLLRAVLADLDPADAREVELSRLDVQGHADLWLDYWSRGAFVVVVEDLDSAEPFAVLGMGPAHRPGVGSAGFLARDHRRFAAPLRRLAAATRGELRATARRAGFELLEACAWRGHPTASRLLGALGFVPMREAAWRGLDPETWQEWTLSV